MRKKPELLVSVGSVDELSKMIAAGADAVNVGSQLFSLRMPGHFDQEDLEKAVAIAHAQGAKIYVSVNKLFENDELDRLPGYLTFLHDIGVDAITFGDPAVLMAMKQAGVDLNLHWNAEMTSTNYKTAEYWGSKGATRVVLARELNLEEIHEFKRNTQLEVQVQVHGMTNIYHSKRYLIQSYLGHLGVHDHTGFYGINQQLYLNEHERRELKLPIYEDENGTHIMSPDDICLIECIDELLEEPIDSLKIEGLMKSPEYNETVVRCYREAIDAYCSDPDNYEFNPEWLKQIERLQAKDRELTFGFLFKEQVY